METPTQYNSPKRKREPPAISTIPPTPPSSSPLPAAMLQASSLPPIIAIEEEKEEEDGTVTLKMTVESGGSSPRTKVAYNFQGLRLEDASDVARLDLSGKSGRKGLPQLPRDDEATVRKRVKILRRSRDEDEDEDEDVEIPETPDVRRYRQKGKETQFAVVIGKERVSGAVDPIIAETAKGLIFINEVDPIIFRGSGGQVTKLKGAGLQRAYPSINRLADSKSRSKKRTATPPLGAKSDEAEDMEVVDDERSALTWHDDEITGHDPDDPDDDGEGINGIGFKPTPAEAYVRAQKRRAQMTEYRNREAREARKMRSERRRASEATTASREEVETARRVRFMEAEAKSIIPIN